MRMHEGGKHFAGRQYRVLLAHILSVARCLRGSSHLKEGGLSPLFYNKLKTCPKCREGVAIT